MNQAKIITIGFQEKLVLNYDFSYENNKDFLLKGSYVLVGKNNVYGIAINVSNEDENNPCVNVNGQHANTLNIEATFFDPKQYGMNVGDKLRVMVLNEIDSNYFYSLRDYFQSRLDYYETDLELQNSKVSYADFNDNWNRNNPNSTVNENCVFSTTANERGKPRQVIKDLVLSIT